MPKLTWSASERRRRSGVISVLGVLLVLAGAPLMLAQGAGSSTVSGTIVDAGSVVPGALVTLTFAGANNETQTNTAAGTYGTVINPRQFGFTARFDF